MENWRYMKAPNSNIMSYHMFRMPVNKQNQSRGTYQQESAIIK